MRNISRLMQLILIPWLVYPAMCFSVQNDLVVVSMFPNGGVYNKQNLIELVSDVEEILSIRNQQGLPALSAIDSLATENIIVSENDSVRFRRLIEKRELTIAGLNRMKALVNSHPLLHDRLVDPRGDELHIWLRLSDSTQDSEKQVILSKATSILTQDQECRLINNGALFNARYEEWILNAASEMTVNDAYENLSKLNRQEKNGAISAYNATDLISFLKISMGDPTPVSTDNPREIEQLYMIAESVRSRHLHQLANPNFSNLKQIRLIQSDKGGLSSSVFDSSLSRIWKASLNTYVSLDCRQTI